MFLLSYSEKLSVNVAVLRIPVSAFYLLYRTAQTGITSNTVAPNFKTNLKLRKKSKISKRQFKPVLHFNMAVFYKWTEQNN